MREYFESLETNHLAPYAIKSHASKGRCIEEPPSVTRTCFQRDRDRIIHSKAFRRLKHKTQVFTATLSDHHRSRLTHTIEVAQITRHLARLFRLNEDLAECIALAHDLGHSPFGHSGETMLNTLLKDEGGFEHNLHSLKIVEILEQKYPTFPGLNLSFEVKEGLKKHHTPWDNPKETSTFISLEAQTANIADEIAYNNHDIDDGLNSELLEFDDLLEHVTLFKQTNALVSKKYSNLSIHERKHLINSQLISQQVLDAFNHSHAQLSQLQIESVDALQHITTPIITFSPEMNEKNNELRTFLYRHLYQHPQVAKMNTEGKNIIKALFEFYDKNIHLVPQTYVNLTANANAPRRAIGDYIAAMTDRFAAHQYSSHTLN